MQQGQLLIAGVVDTGGTEKPSVTTRFLAGKGEVWARTWYDLTVRVPLTYEKKVYTGKEKRSHTLIWGENRLKIGAKGSSICNVDCDKIKNQTQWTLFGLFALPVTWETETLLPYELEITPRSRADAEAQGKDVLETYLDALVGETGSVTQRRFSTAVEGDTLVVTLSAECEEQNRKRCPLPSVKDNTVSRDRPASTLFSGGNTAWNSASASNAWSRRSICSAHSMRNVRPIESDFKVTISNREGELRVNGEVEDHDARREGAQCTAQRFQTAASPVTEQNVRYVISLVRAGREDRISELTQDVICISSKGRPIKPETIGQKKIHRVRFEKHHHHRRRPGRYGQDATSPWPRRSRRSASSKVNRIILTRPAVEAGEKLGFLPGDLQNKVDPYLRPLYDALVRHAGRRRLTRNIWSAAASRWRRWPICAAARWTTAFIILDEAQNTTPEQMKMFLTRMGFNSKAVITGDITQIDLPDGKMSGLKEAMRVLQRRGGHRHLRP